MKWTVLSDNRTNDDQLQTEHGLSILLETDKHCILLDTGASDVFIRNAEKMGIDLSTVDYVFISHGHSDHAGGLKHLMKINDKAQVIVSPDAVSGKFYSKRGNLHSITTEWQRDLKSAFFRLTIHRRLLMGFTSLLISSMHIRCPKATNICLCRMQRTTISTMTSDTNLHFTQMAYFLRVVPIAAWRTFWRLVLIQ